MNHIAVRTKICPRCLSRHVGDDMIPNHQEFHFPLSSHGHYDDSRFYLAILTIGCTSRTFRDKDGFYWICSTEHLTTKGQNLYKQLDELYEGCTIHLTTWLDT